MSTYSEIRRDNLFSFRTARGLVQSLFSMLPSRLKRAIATAIVPTLRPSDRYELMSSIARGLNVVRFAVKGEHGVFESLPSDRAVLQGYAISGFWARRTVGLVQAALNGTNGTYLDIGANIGLTCVPIAKLKTVNCYAFEPEPRNFENLARNAAANDVEDNLRLFQLGLSDVPGTVTFEIAGGNLGDHRIQSTRSSRGSGHGKIEERSTIDIRVERLDAMNLSITDPLVVKIDTQGAEAMILRGGRDTIGRARLLIMEYWPYGISQFQDSADDILAFLKGAFESISFAMNEDGSMTTPTTKDDAIAYLRTYFRENSGRPDVYMDIIARNS